MPDKGESFYPQDWFKKGKQDLNAARTLLTAGNLCVAAFHIQQAIEKCLKGYLLSKGWKLRRIHDLEELLDEAISHNPDFEKFHSLCQVATEYYVEERYPLFASSELNSEELKGMFEQLEQLVVSIISGTEFFK